jgi:hypothetical protein
LTSLQKKYYEETTLKTIVSLVIGLLVLLSSLDLLAQEENSVLTKRRISVREYRNKMMAGWIGQMAGVGWGAPTEFRYLAKTIPADQVPEWKPEMINVYNQDDLYVEMTFLRSMEVHGFDVSMNQAGLDFANSAYNLWVANKSGRDNLRKGIAPPNSGHPAYNENADAIDYQIEADFSGLIAPGLPNAVISLGEKFGSLMNYGDGKYGGQFVGAMYAEAFFENDPGKIVQAGLKAIPEGSQYAEMVRDVIKWHGENHDDWEKTWVLITKKYHENPDYRQFTTPGVGKSFNVDAKLNGAFIVMGLLYGESDLDQTIIISMRCGQDSDCNPSNAAGVLFTTIGFDKLPEKFISGLNRDTKFSFTEYTFSDLINVSEKLAREAVTRAGGRIDTNEEREELFVIPVAEPIPAALEQSWNPGPPSENRFSEEELAQIEGHWIYNFSLLLLFLLAFVLFKENHNLKSLSVLFPLIVIILIFELFKFYLDSKLLDSLNVIVIFESLAVGIAIILLLGQQVSSTNFYISIVIAFGVFALTGVAGVIGFYDGRYVAATESTLSFYAVQAGVWLLAMVLTALFCRKRYSHVRFNLFTLLSLFISHLIGMYLITLQFAAANEAKSDMAGNIQWILIGAVALMIVHYIITLPFLILTYRSSEYEKRFFNWIGQS